MYSHGNKSSKSCPWICFKADIIFVSTIEFNQWSTHIIWEVYLCVALVESHLTNHTSKYHRWELPHKSPILRVTDCHKSGDELNQQWWWGSGDSKFSSLDFQKTRGIKVYAAIFDRFGHAWLCCRDREHGDGEHAYGMGWCGVIFGSISQPVPLCKGDIWSSPTMLVLYFR